MAGSIKRKAGNDAAGGASLKKKKGNKGKWKAPRADASDRPKANTIEPGDMGIWVTCPMHVKGKAAREMELLFDEYADKIYGIKAGEGRDASDASDEDIESAIQKELGALEHKGKRASDHVFSEVRIKEECLLFMKCKPPIAPVEFSRRICQDAAGTGHGGPKARYLNRLTPLTAIAKASENGLDEAARKALAGHFKLKSGPEEDAKPEAADAQPDLQHDDSREKAQAATYAIRPSIRSHNTMNRDNVIKRIAESIDSVHKVNLGSPDKVILVDIYQTVCGLSVVPGDWDSLKRYNLTELYKLSSESKGEAIEPKGTSDGIETLPKPRENGL